MASPTRALRFHSDLSPDLAFDERVIPGTGTGTGTGSAVVAPYMMTLSDGYLAGGSTAQHASLWRFNSAWRALPASIDGATASLSGTVVSAVENRGKVYVTLESSLLEIAAINPDGSLDRELGREGVLPLLALQPGERNVGVIPTTHSRMYQVVRNGERYVFYRIWN